MKVLFAVPPVQQCSVHCTGLNVWRVMQQSPEIEGQLLFPERWEDLVKTALTIRPEIILVEHHTSTMPWLTPVYVNVLREAGFKMVAIVHNAPFDYYDAMLYPSHYPPLTSTTPNTFLFRVPIPIPPDIDYRVHHPPVVGSLGFMQPHKDYVGTTRMILKQFKRARIRFVASVAPNGINDPNYAEREMIKCRQLIPEGNNYEIETICEFLPIHRAVDWLAENDLNCFLYRSDCGGGRASALDLALAARKPIAVTKSPMTRALHHCTPSVCVEDRSLPEIMKSGIAPLVPVYQEFSDEHALDDLLKCLRFVMQK